MSTIHTLIAKQLAVPADYHFWRSHARFIIENIAAAVVAVDVNGCITIFNSEAEKVFHKSAEETIGKHLKAVFPSIPEHEYYLLQVLNNGRNLSNVEGNYCPYTKHEGVFVHSVAVVKGPHGEVGGAIWMRKDLTYERRFQKEVSNAEVQAIVSQIAAGTAHEIRNPLTTAKGYIQLAQNSCDESIQPYMKMALEEIDQVNRIITDLLALIHPGAEGLQFISINSLIVDLMQLVGNLGTMVNINITSTLDEQAPLCMLDATLVKQAILNVLRNAIQAMPEGGVLTVSTEYYADTDKICIAVSDTGVGIRQEDLSRIFSPFFSTKVEGSGLGLTLTNRILQHHDGYVQVESKENNGTTVSLIFPISQL